MKVAFWNGANSSDGVTDYMAAVGTIISIEKKCEVVLASNHISNHMLQDCFSSRTKEEIAQAPYRFFYETPEYFRALWDMRRNRKGNIMEIPMEGVTIIYPPDVMDKKVFYYAAPRSSIYFLDVAGENSVASPIALEEADVIVVFLPQDETKIQKFFDRFSSVIPKALFVIDGFKRNGGCSRRKIAAKYGIRNNNIEIIPYNREFKEACEEGKLEFFLRDNYLQATKEPQYNFVSCLKAIAKRLYEQYRSEHMKEYEGVSDE